MQPKWKGKFTVGDSTISGAGQTAFAVVGKMKGWDFWRAIAKQEPLIMRDARLQVEWLSKGKYPILFAPDSGILTEFIAAGAPITGLTPKEGSRLTGGSGNVSLINRAPHPNAARVFINWLLTKEGITLFSEAGGRQGARVDVSASALERVDPLSVRQPGVKYFNSMTLEFKLKTPEYLKLAEEIFGHLVK